MSYNFTIAIDFDGTIVEEAYPGIGKLRKDADKYINMLYDEGINILINTCRAGSFEGEAENFLRRKGIKYHYLNCNLPERVEFFKQDCRKLSAEVYIDDKCLFELPSWEEIYKLIKVKHYNFKIKYNTPQVDKDVVIGTEPLTMTHY